MSSDTHLSNGTRFFLIAAAVAFTYSTVLWKLGIDWWTDDNYSHGLLIPIVIIYLVWLNLEKLRLSLGKPQPIVGYFLITLAGVMLLGGTLASVLYAQRISLLLMLAGIIVGFFGIRTLRYLTLPFALLFLSIPLPQLIFNKIAFPLQLLASKIAERVIILIGIPASRRGNVIDIEHSGTSELISLEVVEACSGIRSLMTLITLALLLGYFTRRRRSFAEMRSMERFLDRDVLRTALLVVLAVPVAILTNSARVVATGVVAFYYGAEEVSGTSHDLAGSMVFISALAILAALNFLLKRVLGGDHDATTAPSARFTRMFPVRPVRTRKIVTVAGAILFCGLLVNGFQYRGEAIVERKQLEDLPANLGRWEQRNEDIRFDAATEEVLRASDYVMRDYYGPGKRLNVYVGYYGSQRAGATYHSPLSCLPGSGWELTDRELIEIRTPRGRNLTANKYIVRRGSHAEYLIYWYQGRGRTSHNEYFDRLYISIDSLTRRRTDGGLVRVLTPVGKDPEYSLSAAVDLSGHLADVLMEFVPN